MKFKQYTDVHEFYKDTYDVLMLHESQNTIALGNLKIGCDGLDKTEWRDPANWFMATVSDSKGIQLTALMTPPHNIFLYATNNKININTINCLIEGLNEIDLPGVITEKSLAIAFAEEYSKRKNLTFKTTMDLRIHELTKVNPDIPIIGTVRLLSEKDMPFFPFWFEAFHAAEIFGKTEMNIPQESEKYLYRISTNKQYVLEVDNIPVSMAGFTKDTNNLTCVSFVYTPVYYRKKGYATSIVAQLSQIALDKGFTKCVLYTDLENPTSNSIYQKIGYKPVCDSLILKFEKQE